MPALGSIEWREIAQSAILVALSTLLCASIVHAESALLKSKPKFEAVGVVEQGMPCSNTMGCTAPEGHCQCINWDDVGGARVEGLGTVREINVGFLIDLDSCVDSPSGLFQCCPTINGSLQFFKEPGPTAYNYDLLNGTVCGNEGPYGFTYSAAFSPQMGIDHSTLTSAGVPSTGQFVGIAPVAPGGHLLFFMH